MARVVWGAPQARFERAAAACVGSRPLRGRLAYSTSASKRASNAAPPVVPRRARTFHTVTSAAGTPHSAPATAALMSASAALTLQAEGRRGGVRSGSKKAVSIIVVVQWEVRAPGAAGCGWQNRRQLARQRRAKRRAAAPSPASRCCRTSHGPGRAAAAGRFKGERPQQGHRAGWVLHWR